MATLRDVVSRRGPAAGEVASALEIMKGQGTGRCRRVAENIDLEFRLPDSIWESVIDEMLLVDFRAADAVAAAELLGAVRKAFASLLQPAPLGAPTPSRRPLGPALVDLNPCAFGRLASFTQLANFWSAASSIPSASPGSTPPPVLTVMGAKLFLEQMAQPAAFHASRMAFSRYPLGAYIMWSTFDAENLNDDPFHPRTPKISDLVHILGLNPADLFSLDLTAATGLAASTTPSFLLLRYCLPTGLDVHVPTVAEAYAGSGPANYYFHVWTEDIDVARRAFPKTMPTDDVAEAQRGVPEVVHSVILGGQLTGPVEIHRFAPAKIL